jgi:ABC-type dipeptide/oligopeptide/nickel transport system ATPase subunit
MVGYDNPFVYVQYIEGKNSIPRKEMEEVETLFRRGHYISILAPRQCGKTTLLKEILEKPHQDKTVYVSFKENVCKNRNDVLQSFRQAIENTIQPSVDEEFHEFFSELEKKGKFIFLVDELPASEEIAFNLLCGIRAYFSENFSSSRCHQFIFAGSIDLAQFSREQNDFISPFNIAQTIYLDDFSKEEVTTFIKGKTKNTFTQEAIDQIFEYTAGHPYLTQYLCAYLYDKKTKIESELEKGLSTLVKDAKIENTANIRAMLDKVGKHSEWYKLLGRILKGEEIPFTRSHKTIRGLELNGCIKRGKDNHCVVRNPIYQEILDNYFEVASSTRSSLPSKIWIIHQLQDRSDNSRILAANSEEDIPIYSLETGKEYAAKIIIHKGEIDNIPFMESVEIKARELNKQSVELAVEVESFYDLNMSGGKIKEFNLELEHFQQSFDFSLKGTEKTDKPVKAFINLYQDMFPIKVVKLLFEFK